MSELSSRVPSLRTRLRVLQLECRTVPTLLGNQVFPLDNPWNQIITNAPVAANSDAIINRIVSRHGGTAPKLHADFGNPATDGALYGIPINVVDSSVPKVNVVIPSFGYPDESDIVQVPIPANAVIEGDGPTGPLDSSERGDSHLLVYDKTANVLYELYQAVRPNETVFPYGGDHATGQWGAYQISFWDLKTNSYRTIGATSADAAGLPILPGLVRPDDVLPVASGGQGKIDHAIRMTVQQTLNTFVYPASHAASSLTSTDLPRMGERFRLKSSFVIPANWSPEAKAIAQAMKDYGMIVADNGSDMYFQGTPSTQWNMDSVLQIQQIRASSFEVVNLTPVVTGLSVSSGPIAGGTSVTITGQNFSGASGQLSVTFGGTQATSVTIVSDTQLVAVAPAHAAGVVDVRVQSGTTKQDTDGDPVFFGYGTSAINSTAKFTFTSTTPPPAGGQRFAVGTNAGRVATVTMYSADRSIRFRATPFGTSYTGGVRVAVGDVTGDGVPDVVATTNGGIAAQARIIDGATGNVLSTQLLAGTTYSGPVSVAVGDVTGDGVADVALGTNEGGPRARLFRGGTFAKLITITGPSNRFLGGSQVTLGDLNADGKADLVVGGMYATGTRVFGYQGTTLVSGSIPTKLFDTFAPNGAATQGVFLAAGDMNGDGFADLLIGSGANATANLSVISGKALVQSNTRTKLANFAPAGSSTAMGVRVAARDIDGDGKLDILTSSGELVSGFKGGNLPANGLPPLLFAFDTDPNANGGVWVG